MLVIVFYTNTPVLLPISHSLHVVPVSRILGLGVGPRRVLRSGVAKRGSIYHLIS